MTPLEWLALVSVAGVWALFLALALFLKAIDETLEDLGGPSSRWFRSNKLLANIRLGVRAIETQTAALGPAVTTLNAGLSAVRDGLGAIDAHLGGTIEAVSRQKGAR